MFSFLKQKGILFKDAELISEKLKKIIRSGPQQLVFISDFDRTLTTEDSCTSYGVIEHSTLMPASFRKSGNTLKAKYLPYEKDPKLPLEEKKTKMEEWWQLANENILKHQVKKEMIAKMVEECLKLVKLRDGYQLFFDRILENNLPLVIFSAGLGDVLVEILKKKNIDLSKNILVISNFFGYNEEGIAIDFPLPAFHVYNKNATPLLLHTSDYSRSLQQIQARKPNYILLGDSLGDLGMSTGLVISQDQTLLTIGFLNSHDPHEQSVYLDAFDIVLLPESSLEPVNQIFGLILNS